MDWDKIHTIQDILDPTSSDNSEQYDTKRTEANELPFPPLRGYCSSALRFHAADDCHSALVPFAVNGGRPGACPASLSAWLAMSWSSPTLLPGANRFDVT